LQSLASGNWTTQILARPQSDAYLVNSKLEAITIRAVDRLGNLSEPTIWTPKKVLPEDSRPVGMN